MTPLWLLAAVVWCGACGSPGEAGMPLLSQPAEAGLPVYLEFRLPDEFSTKTPNGAYLVTGFRVGYFREHESEPVFTIDYRRDEVTVTNTTGRVALQRPQLPGGGSSVTVRLQTLSRDARSVWSDPSAARHDLVTFVVPGANAARAPRRTVSLAEVEKHERLFVELKKTLQPAAKLEQVLGAFTQIDQLAVAVVLCRDNRIPLDKLAEAMIGPPRRTIAIAVSKVQPKLDSTALPKARRTARLLLQR